MRTQTQIILLGLVVFAILGYLILKGPTEPPRPYPVVDASSTASGGTNGDLSIGTPAKGGTSAAKVPAPQPTQHAKQPEKQPPVVPAPPPLVWKTIDVPEHGVRFEMPEPVLATREEVHTMGGKQPWQQYTSKFLGGIEFVVMFNPLGAKVDAKRTTAILDGVRDSLVGGKRGKLVEEKPLTLGNHPGRAVSFDALVAKVHAEAHAYVVGPMLCQMIVVVPQGRPIPEEAKRFFDSLAEIPKGEATDTTPPQAEAPAAMAVSDRALAELRRVLADEPEFVKVHAAENLIALGYTDEVRTVFQGELNKYEDKPKYRVGIWRVLTRASAGNTPAHNALRVMFYDKLRKTAFTPGGEDYVHAVETLAKLGYIAPDDEREKFAALLEVPGAPDNLVGYTYWLLANSGKPDDLQALAKLLDSASPMQRRVAAYAMRHLQKYLTPEMVAQLAAAAEKETDDSARVFLLAAAYVTARDDAQAAKFKALLLPYAKTGVDLQKYELCNVLAIRGDKSDLPLLESLMNDPVADTRATAAYALLQVQRRGK